MKAITISCAVLASLAPALSPGVAQAATYAIYDGISAGRADFLNTVSAAGGVASSDTLSGLASGTTIDRGDYTLTRNNGGTVYTTSYGSMSGEVVEINPYSNGSDMGFSSGITLTFGQPVNAVGFEIGDWATCCYVSNLYISFDGGPAQLVASASQSGDGVFPSQADPSWLVNEIYVAAFDDTGEFSTVSFWGDGYGEYLVWGGQVDYALIDEGSLPAVPLPASSLLLLGGLAGLGFLRRRKG